MGTKRPYYLSLKEAREFMKSNNESLRKIAMATFSRTELWDFSQIKSLRDACRKLNLSYVKTLDTARAIALVSVASEAIFELNIIRKALNSDKTIKINEGDVYYPHIIFTEGTKSYTDALAKNVGGVYLGAFKVYGETFRVIGGLSALSTTWGVGNWTSSTGLGNITNLACLGCSSKEIAKHLSKYFGLLIIEAQFGDMEGYKRLNIE